MDTDSSVRRHVLSLLRGGHAHVRVDEALKNFPEPLRGRKVRGVPHTAWELLEHMRIAQWDILEFSRNPAHVSPEFPEGYWPASSIPPNRTAWAKAARAFMNDMEEMIRLVKDPATDLFAAIPHGQGQTVLREALLVADHNAYHIGQMVLLRRMLGAWQGRLGVS
jgi:hypothetical protein